MPRPRKGDVLQWINGGVWELIDTPEVDFSRQGKLTCRAKCVVTPNRGWWYTPGSIHSVYFQEEDVVKSHWSYTEDSFVRFVKETIAEHEEQA